MQLLKMIQSWKDGWKIAGGLVILLIFFRIFGDAGLYIIGGIQIGIILALWFFPRK